MPLHTVLCSPPSCEEGLGVGVVVVDTAGATTTTPLPTPPPQGGREQTERVSATYPNRTNAPKFRRYMFPSFSTRSFFGGRKERSKTLATVGGLARP